MSSVPFSTTSIQGDSSDSIDIPIPNSVQYLPIYKNYIYSPSVSSLFTNSSYLQGYTSVSNSARMPAEHFFNEFQAILSSGELKIQNNNDTVTFCFESSPMKNTPEPVKQNLYEFCTTISGNNSTSPPFQVYIPLLINETFVAVPCEVNLQLYGTTAQGLVNVTTRIRNPQTSPIYFNLVLNLISTPFPYFFPILTNTKYIPGIKNLIRPVSSQYVCSIFQFGIYPTSNSVFQLRPLPAFWSTCVSSIRLPTTTFL